MAVGNPDRIRRPKNGNPRVTETTTPCRIALTGIPLPTARNLDLTIGGRIYDIEAMEMDVEFTGTLTAARVSDKRYTASRRITRADCEAGPVSVVIKPLAARVKFEGRPRPSEGLVVICRSGCRASLQGRNQNAKDFQPVPIPDGKLQQRVKLELKALDYEAKTIEQDLSPGQNTIVVDLVKLPSR